MSDTTKLKNGLFIEDLILYSDLSIIEKFVLADIYTMCKDGRFRYYKLNQTLADMLRVNVKSISRVLNSLEEKCLIRREMSRPYQNSVKTMRRITPVYSNINKLSINNNSPRKK
tara:strand:+ start:965 stop:1306 length:342 start_codon:yes stop_codon:yes gene_type:complete